MKAKLYLKVSLLLVLCAGIPLHARQSDADRKLLEDSKAKAEKGDASAQNDLGVCYYSGCRNSRPKDMTFRHITVRKSK